MPLNRSLSIVLSIAIPLCFGSCATLFNRKTQEFSIATGKNISHLSIDQSLTLGNPLGGDGMEPKIFDVPRSRKPLLIHLQLDSVEKTYVLRPRSSFAYWFNIPSNYGLGMLVDRNKVNRFAYPSCNYLYAKDTTIYRRRFAPIPKGTTRWLLSIPLINDLSMQTPQQRQYNTVGVLGIEMGFDYFYKTDRYFTLSVGAATNVGPEREAIHIKDTVKAGATFYAALRANRVLGNFDIGYGVAVSGMDYARTIYNDSVSYLTSTTSASFGLSFSLQYRIGEKFRVAALYQPDLWSPGLSPAFHYQHYFNFGLAWRFTRR